MKTKTDTLHNLTSDRMLHWSRCDLLNEIVINVMHYHEINAKEAMHLVLAWFGFSLVDCAPDGTAELWRNAIGKYATVWILHAAQITYPGNYHTSGIGICDHLLLSNWKAE